MVAERAAFVDEGRIVPIVAGGTKPPPPGSFAILCLNNAACVGAILNGIGGRRYAGLCILTVVIRNIKVFVRLCVAVRSFDPHPAPF